MVEVKYVLTAIEPSLCNVVITWLFSFLSNISPILVSAVFASLATIKLTQWEEGRKSNIRFKNRLTCLAYELTVNLKDVGNNKKPFHTKALSGLVYDEPMVHLDAVLYKKCYECLYKALILSTYDQSTATKFNARDVQNLMKKLLEFLDSQYRLNI